MGCRHENTVCLNHYEIFRKYMCYDCGKVWMCECEKELALRFLPHQISYCTESGTNIRYTVSGFAKNICSACRSEKEEAHPRSAIYGQKGKIERYYWREIFKTFLTTAQDWLAERNIHVKDVLELQHRFPEEVKLMKKEAKKFWQSQHKKAPKYDLKELTEATFISDVSVPQRYLTARYIQIHKADQKIGKWINQAGQPCSPEDIVAEWYKAEGFSVKSCERSLISILVGTFCVSVIQDPEDPRARIVMRNSTRGWTPNNRDTPVISFLLPEDFGTQEFFKRRSKGFSELFTDLKSTEGFETLFEELLEPSTCLRDYLWVNNDEAVELGRIALRIMPQLLVLKCIEWAIRDFWHRQPGWPDLLVFADDRFRFVEVKTPLDKLSLEQMSWFRWAIEEAAIPCEIVRLRREAVVDN